MIKQYLYIYNEYFTDYSCFFDHIYNFELWYYNNVITDITDENIVYDEYNDFSKYVNDIEPLMKDIYGVEFVKKDNDNYDKFKYQNQYIYHIVNNYEKNDQKMKNNLNVTVYNISMGRGKWTVLIPGIVLYDILYYKEKSPYIFLVFPEH